ncbi:Variant surface glycoprotein [Trypanosoma congolense IL3000]|uniref:Variant surface glycoprotein n=1 Tax=Trypanosoma congolense (strain IL3000) TaxID=1068625 RepID=F9WD34_TRYCI|nr:Variant surface glycoprotein [Trypanosoma congolense IL3000]
MIAQSCFFPQLINKLLYKTLQILIILSTLLRVPLVHVFFVLFGWIWDGKLKLKMKMKVMSVMVMLEVMGMEMHAGEEEEIALNERDFELICNISRSMTGIWETVANPNNKHVDVSHEDESKLGQTIAEILFGSNFIGYAGWIYPLPPGFPGSNPKRRATCVSKKSSTGMPSASDSLATTVLCMCVGNGEDGKGLCGLTGEKNKKWPEGSGVSSKVLDEVWGNEPDEGVMGKCGNFKEYVDIGKERENLNSSLKLLVRTLENKSGILGLSESKCGETNPCAKVTKNPKWLNKLEEFNELTEKIKEKHKAIPSEPKIQEATLSSSSSDSTPSSTAPEFTPRTKQDPQPIMSQATVEKPKRDSRKTHEEKPIPEPVKKTKDILQKEEEANTPPPENETSGFPITIPKWPLLAALIR